VLEDGRITAVGPHDDLLNSSPTYQRLYQLQFIDQPEAQTGQPAESLNLYLPGCEPAFATRTQE
jgi:ATP-binding cassette, subfamily B, bacterial MsbA